MADTVLLVAILLGLAVLVSGLFRRLPLPESVLLVLAGLLLSELGRHWPAAAHLAELRLSPDLVFYVLLPALVFESGLNLDTRRLLRELAPIVTLAVPALVLSSALIGTGLWLVFGLEPLVALLFGALISATDPVAVVALFREVGAPARLAVLVEGESLFNDATALVVFGMVLALLLAAVPVDVGSLLVAVPRFLWVFLAGVVLGSAFGALASELAHRLHSPTPAMLAMSVAAAYMSFIVAEHVAHVSGVMAAVGASITFGALSVTRLTRDARQVLGETWELLAFVCNALLFLLVGIAVEPASLLSSWPLILAAVVLIHLARAVAVYGLVPLTTRLFSLPPVAVAQRHIMWWGGLKGGLAIAMALSIPESLPERQLVLDVTVGVVLFTLLVNASTLRPLLQRLGLDRLSVDERAELDEALLEARERVERNLDAFRRDGVMSSRVHHRLVRSVMHALAPEARRASAPVSRVAQLGALRAEADALSALYECRAIDQYTFLEYRDALLHDREAHAAQGPEPGRNPYRRIEAAALRWLRERDWAAGWLSRYQSLRLREHLQRNIAGLILAHAGLASLERCEERSDPEVQALIAVYRERIRRRRARLDETHADSPWLLDEFQEATFRRAALEAALLAVEHDRAHGQLGAKAGAAIGARIRAALERTPALAHALGPEPADLMASVGIFQGLPREVLEALGAEARPVTFLPGDVIIGEGEHGDSLYVISRGAVVVTRRGEEDGTVEELAHLDEGDIIGEAALLGDPVRNATVTATQPSTLLRITRGQALEVANRWPAVSERLQRLDATRH